MSFILIALIFIGHWVSDFVLQSSWMATNKSKSNIALGAHVLTYTTSLILVVCAPIMVFTYLSPSYTSVAHISISVSLLIWAAINGVFHFMTDYYTSRWTSRLWQAGDTHNFFVVIGLDQTIHYMTLLGTFPVLNTYL